MRLRLLPRTALVVGILSTLNTVSYAQTIVANWTGATYATENTLGVFVAPPDTMGAVGPNHVVELINGNYIVFNKSGTVVSSPVKDSTFWNNAGISSTITNAGISDPHIVYDASTQTWFASEINVSSSGNQLMVARSNTSDPTAGWKAVNFTANVGFGDYPALSVDGNAVYISLNNFSNGTASGAFTGTSLFSIPKTDLLQATPVTTNMTKFENLTPSGRGFTLQAAQTFGSSPSHGIIISTALDNSANYVSGVINRYDVTGPGAAAATLTGKIAINVLATPEPGLAHQPDGTVMIDALDSRISGQVVYQNGNLFFVRAITVGTKDALRWTVMNEATNAIVSEGTISDPNFDYFQGSIAVNSSGDVVVGFNRSGTGVTDFIGSYARVGKFTGSTIVFGNDIQLTAGQANYHLIGGNGERWGDFSATRVDPVDSSLFWTFQEFAQPSNVWATQITSIRINSTSVPEPATLTMILGVGTGLVFFRRRRSKK